MHYSIKAIASGFLVSLMFATSSPAQNRPKGRIIVPDSSVAKPGDTGQRAHTNVRYFLPDHGFRPGAVPQAKGAPPFPGYFYETPASLACIYHLTRGYPGCNPNVVTTNLNSGSKAIAIVDAYDDGNALADLQNFSKQFGLPAPDFETVYASGIKPAGNSGWELEESLDIEWAHAMAPHARIYLVEAVTNALSDLFVAEEVAANLVAGAGGGEVSNSWGGAEFSGETEYDSLFFTRGVVFFASTGDAEGTEWPGSSVNVVSVGGTSISRNPLSGEFQGEYAWNLAGGGPSYIEKRPKFQDRVKSVVGISRGLPDVSADADPSSGVWVLDSGNGGWYIVGGTSVASPVFAGIVNSAGTFALSSQEELTNIYGNLGVTTDFNDIQAGACYFYNGYLAAKGYDFCTGVGSPYGLTGK